MSGASKYSPFFRFSFRSILVCTFLLASVVPIVALQSVSYRHLSTNLQANMNDLAQSNVAQASNNLELVLDAYEDLLYQVYTNDEIIALMDDIDAGVNSALAMNQLRRTLRGLCYAKDGIESLMVITAEGHAIYYDKLTAKSVASSWLGEDNLTVHSVLDLGIQDYETHLIAPHYAYSQGSKDTYLFHMVHRIIDYKSVNRDVGVAVISINEDVLQGLCNPEEGETSFRFIVDTEGRLISYPVKDKIGTASRLQEAHAPNDEDPYQSLLADDGFASPYTQTYQSEYLRGWRVVNVVDQGSFYEQIRRQMQNNLYIGIAVLLASTLIIIAVTSLLSRSMDRVTAAMRHAQDGDLTACVNLRQIFFREMASIARTYNMMMERMAALMEEVRQATRRQKDSEIKALEAQINPHFLYNTLDSVNWMAIDREQYEISQMISYLAKIMRYSINNSNGIVPLREEIEWLRQYIYLQQVRRKGHFDYLIDVQEHLLDIPVHKLILQPFVENAIVHAFKDNTWKNRLTLTVKEQNGIRISIHDNGRGIEPGKLSAILERDPDLEDHIGIANAIDRIRMYYGDAADIQVHSEWMLGTTVTIRLDLEGGSA